MHHGEVENETDIKLLDKTEANKSSVSNEKDAKNAISKKSNIIDHQKLINNTISNFFDENHLFDLLNKQILFKNKKNKNKLNKLVNGECCGSSSTASNVETSIGAVKHANELAPTATTTSSTATNAAINVTKEGEKNKSCSMSSTSSSSSSTTSSNSKSALTGLDKKLLKKKIMSNIGKIKIEDYVSFFLKINFNL